MALLGINLSGILVIFLRKPDKKKTDPYAHSWDIKLEAL
jgi:hypothetical protein